MMPPSEDTRNANSVRFVAMSPELRNTLVLSVGLLLAFSSMVCIVNLQTSVNDVAGLGVASLACMYATYTVSCVLTPVFVRYVGAKRSLLVAAIIFTIYAATNIYPTWPSLLIASLLQGVAMGPFFATRTYYVAQQAQMHTTKTRENLHSSMSRLNGISLAITSLSQVFGNLVSSLTLHGIPANNMTSFNTSSATCGRYDCPDIGNTLSNPTAGIPEPPQDHLYILFGVCCGLNVLGVIILLFVKRLPPEDLSQFSAKATLVSCFTLNLQDVKMMLLIPMCLGQSMLNTMLFAVFTKSYVSCTVGVGWVGYVMAVYGASCFVFSLTMGRVARYTGRVALIVVFYNIQTAILAVMYVWIPDPSHYSLMYVVPVVWGLADMVMHTQGQALVVIAFPDKKDAALANYFAWRSVGYFTSFAVANAMCVSSKLTMTGCVQVLGFVLYLVVEVILWHQKRSSKRHKAERTSLCVHSDDDSGNKPQHE